MQGELMGDSDIVTAEQDTTAVEEMLDLSDAELIENTRTGSIAAFEELWQRHSVFGLIVARAEAGENADAVNNEAWSRILRQILDKVETHTAFRPYLYSAIREAATDYTVPADSPDTRMAEAFSSLPARWQEVLWYHNIEKMAPDDVIFLTGIPADTIEATQSRARKGLTTAWLTTNADHAPEGSDCRWVREHSRAFIKKTLPQHDVDTIERHLASCTECRSVLATAGAMGPRAPKMLLSAMAGAAGAAALTSYLASNGPIVINEDPLPEPVISAFFALSAPSAPPVELAPIPVVAVEPETPPVPPEQLPSTYVEQEHNRRRKGAFWIALLIALALIAAIIAVAVLGSKNTPAPGPATSNEPVASASVRPSASAAPSVQPSSQPSAVPSTQPSEEPTQALEPTEPAVEPTEAAAEQPVQAPPTQAAAPPVAPVTQPAVPQPPAVVYQVASIRSIDTGSGGVLYPRIAGTSEPGDTITVTINGNSFTTRADAAGNWSLTPTSGLVSGTQTVTASASSNSAPVTSSFTLASPPRISVATTSLTISGVPGASVQVTIDQTTQVIVLDGSGQYVSVLKLGPGDHSVSGRYFADGRSGPGTGTIKVTG